MPKGNGLLVAKELFFILHGNLLWWPSTNVIAVVSHSSFITLPTIFHFCFSHQVIVVGFLFKYFKIHKNTLWYCSIPIFQGKHRNVTWFLGHDFMILYTSFWNRTVETTIHVFIHLFTCRTLDPEEFMEKWKWHADWGDFLLLWLLFPLSML